MRRRFAYLTMFALFGLAHVTLDRVPQSVLKTLRGGAEHVERIDRSTVAARTPAER